MSTLLLNRRVQRIDYQDIRYWHSSKFCLFVKMWVWASMIDDKTPCGLRATKGWEEGTWDWKVCPWPIVPLKVCWRHMCLYWGTIVLTASTMGCWDDDTLLYLRGERRCKPTHNQVILVWVAVLNRSREGEIYIVVEVFKDSDQVAVASTRYLSRIVFYSIINPAILGLSVLSVLFHEIKEFLWLVLFSLV